MSGLMLMGILVGPHLLAGAFIAIRYIARRRRRTTGYSLVNDLKRRTALLFRRIKSIGRKHHSDKGHTSENVDLN